MSALSQDLFQAYKQRLRASFIAQLPMRLHQARSLLLQLTESMHPEDTLNELHVIFHTLKGSGASFGLDCVNALAQQAEQSVREVLDGERQLSPEILMELDQQIEALSALDLDLDIQEPPPAESGFKINPSIQVTHAIADDRRLIDLCDQNPDQLSALAEQLSCFGYETRAHRSPQELRQALADRLPAAIVMDLAFLALEENSGPRLLASLNTGLSESIPLVVLSADDSFAARLQAVRAGGQAYCCKPVRVIEVAEMLDRLTNRLAPDPYHILIVDDDPDVAQFYALILESAGMHTRIAATPEAVLAILDGFDADLVLMDLYMPDCSGPELARVLRQMPGYLGLPIIYISSETNARRQFRALEVGADGFITKPIEPERLVTEVSLRAERMRTLRSLMIRDSLTGLFNHNTTLQMLKVTLASCQRHGTPLCLAMIDVDHFKSVNDTYGHPVGDQVLMALGRTLRLRLRESDIIGRYGGEEFAIVMTGVELSQAKVIVDTLRESFAAIAFPVDRDTSFHCTFSGGLAAYPEHATASDLIRAADKALYCAKRAGRNRILSASRHAAPLTG